MGILSLDDIIRAPDLETKEIVVPGWKGSVIIQSFSIAKRDVMLKKSMVNGQPQNDFIITSLLVAGMVNPALTEDQAEELKQKSVRAIEYITNEIMKLNGMLPEEAKRIEQSFPANAGSAVPVSPGAGSQEDPA